MSVRLRRWMAVLMALIVSMALLVGSSPRASAGDGGGHGEDGGDGTTPADMSVEWKVKDSWAATNAGVKAALTEMGYPVNTGDTNADTVINNSINAANAECVASYTGTDSADCRLVGVGIAIGDGKWWAANHVDVKDTWMTAFKAATENQTYDYNGTTWNVDTQWTDKKGTRSVSKLAETSVDAKVDASLRVIVLAKDQPAPPSYKLSITTNQQSMDVKAGSATAVHDVIHASNNGSSIKENVDAKVILHYKGQAQRYMDAKQVSKSVSIANSGDTRSPDFTPADFGWKLWADGDYWFDIQVPQAGKMADTVDTADEEPSETFSLASVRPKTPVKTITKGTSASRMTNTTTITTGTGQGAWEMTISDQINPNGVNYSVSDFKIVDKGDNNRDLSGEFTMGWDKSKNLVTAVRTADKGVMPANHDVAFSFVVTVSKPDFSKIQDEGKLKWNQEPEVSTGSREFPTWRPNPDKAWIRWDETAKRWQTVIDPERTNKVGADDGTFLDGDKVGIVVNGTVAADLVKDQLTTFALTDDYSASDYIFDRDAVDQIRVFEAEASTDRKSSVADIANGKGTDVTDKYTIKVEGTKVVASAKAAHLKELTGMAKPKQVTLLIAGKANYANGKGAAQVRKDLGKQEAEEVAFCAVSGRSFTNSASQTVNDHEIRTNEPKICGYIPPNPKNVEAEASQGGDHEDIDGKVVFPGQKVEYTLTTQPTLPATLVYKIRTVGFVDAYDEYLTPDKQTLEVTDLSTGRPISKKQYATKWDDAKHKFTVTITDNELLAQWTAGGTPKLQVRFEGTVNEDAPVTPSTKFENSYDLVINNSITPSNEVVNIPDDPDPKKEDVSSKDPTISIDGKTLLLGETGNYVVTLDAKDFTKDNTAYKVQRLGVVDDFDDEYLSVDSTKIEVLGADGKDVTGKFNIQLKDGVVYVFAKTVDTEIPATGETVKGDPQPADLKAYSTRKFDPLKDASIDQNLLGQQYRIVLPYKVIKVTDGYQVKNTATQITNDRKDVTNTVNNPLKVINPEKDVTVKVGGDSVDGKSVYKDRLFLYRLDSSTLPANRAYPDVKEWAVTDQLDPEYDQYTGQWAVYAASDLYKDGQVLAKKGERVAGSGFDSKAFGRELFTATANDKGLVTITATDVYMELASADAAHEQGWTAYIQCKRVQYTERHENVFTERYNGVDRQSNIVWTKTPDLTPSLTVEKWDTKSGFPAGDRDDAKDALTVTGDTDITFTITNTSKTDPDTNEGAVFQAKDLNLEDSTIAGDGTVVDLRYPDNWGTLVLKPGESVDVHGTLKGVTEKHTDRAKVTGTPLVSCPVDETDLFGGDKKTDGKKTDGKKTDGEPDAETVTIDGKTYCTDTKVESNTDDWSGKAGLLAQTGAGMMWFAAIVVLLAAGGLAANVVYFQVSKRSHAAKHSHAL